MQVDLPPGATAPVAHVVTQLKNGRVTTKALKFRKRGWSSTTLGFSAKKVRLSEVVVANASRRTSCWTFPTDSVGNPIDLACYGTPKDDGARFKIVGSVFRR